MKDEIDFGGVGGLVEMAGRRFRKQKRGGNDGGRGLNLATFSGHFELERLQEKTAGWAVGRSQFLSCEEAYPAGDQNKRARREGGREGELSSRTPPS